MTETSLHLQLKRHNKICGVLFFWQYAAFLFYFLVGFFFILLLCCQASANVAFLLVYFEDFFYGRVHLRTYYGQFFGYIFMYGCRKYENVFFVII